MRVDDDPAYENHLVRNPLDVIALLRSMQKLGVPVKVRFEDSGPQIDARIISVKPEYHEVMFEGNGTGGVTWAGGDDVLQAEASYDYTVVRFTGLHVEAVSNTTFRCRIPKAVARLQRRNSTRFPVPALNPPVLRIMSLPAKVTVLRVLDISLGGVSGVVEDESFAAAAGARFENCTLHLPRSGAIPTGLQVVWSAAATEGELRGGQRLGCRFTDMALLSLEHVRAYVNLLERDSLK